MPIYRGDRKIASVYRGDRKIVRIYRGGRQVYSARKRIKLFGDVYKAKYVLTNSTATNVQFPAQANFDATQRIYEFSYSGTASLVVYLQAINATAIKRNNITLGGNKNNVPLPTDSNINKVVINKDKLYFNDAFVRDLVIGETLDKLTVQKLYFISGYSFYEMKIYDNDVLAYHFVPAYQIINGAILYGVAELINEDFEHSKVLNGEPEYESE